MYCPVCFNDSLKLGSNGLVKMTFNGKSKATSQFYYNLKEDTPTELQDKLRKTIRDYFQYYAGFQNRDKITEVSVYSNDFRCSNGCGLSLENKMNVINIVVVKEDLIQLLKEEGQRHQIEVELKETND